MKNAAGPHTTGFDGRTGIERQQPPNGYKQQEQEREQEQESSVIKNTIS